MSDDQPGAPSPAANDSIGSIEDHGTSAASGDTEMDGEVIYKKERPLRQALIIFVGIPVLGLLILFVVGLALGFAGVRPPTIDPEIITSRISEPTTTAPTQTKTPPSSREERLAAYNAGKSAGEQAKHHDKAIESFWAGFNAGVK